MDWSLADVEQRKDDGALEIDSRDLARSGAGYEGLARVLHDRDVLGLLAGGQGCAQREPARVDQRDRIVAPVADHHHRAIGGDAREARRVADPDVAEDEAVLQINYGDIARAGIRDISALAVGRDIDEVRLAGDPALTELVEASDALLLLGVIISDGNFGVSARHIDLRRTIQALDERVTLGFHTYTALPLTAVVDALLARTLPRCVPTSVQPLQYPSGLVADEAPIAPNDIACAVNDLFCTGERLPIAADVGDCLFTAMDIENTALVACAYYASMGFAFPPPSACRRQAGGGRSCWSAMARSR